MNYVLKQWPAFKAFDQSEFSPEQWSLRLISSLPTKGVFEKDKRVCRTCGVEQLLTEFWYSDKAANRRKRHCRDCLLRRAGVIEIGKLRFSYKIAEKGFKRCAVCKTTKPILEFHRQKNKYKGVSSNCKECSSSLHKQFNDNHKGNVTDWYAKSMLNECHGIENPSKGVIDNFRKQLIRKRQNRRNIKDESIKFGVHRDTVKNRIKSGVPLSISEHELKSIAKTLGQIRVTDTVNGKVFLFKNSLDTCLFKMFSRSTVTRCLAQKRVTKIGSNSKYPNPCLIERVVKNNKVT